MRSLHVRRRLRSTGLAALVVTAVLGSPTAAQESSPSPSPDGSSGGATYRGSDPERDLQAYDPKALDVVRVPDKLMGHDDRRAMRLVPGAVELVQGATVLASAPVDTSSPLPFDRVADAIADPEWVEETSPGEFLLRAAFVQAPGTEVLFGGEGVRTLRLATLPHVFLGGVGAEARFEDVSVTSWDEGSGSPEEDPDEGRPFILYENGSVLDIVGSEISHLGYDRSTAYGVAWRLGATGSLIDSEIHHSFFGVYTYEAHDIEFRDNVLRDNVYYGLDPHDFSTGLVVVGNEAYGNGSHGIIFSRGVVNGIVRGNHSHDNGGNGIVMDFESDRNLVEGNLVEDNQGDGIVILGSSDVTVRDNLVRGNRVGVRLNNQGAGSLVERNRIVGNEVGVEVYGGAHDTRLRSNRIEGSVDTGIVLEEAGATSVDDVVHGGPVGVEIRAPASLDGTSVEGAETGVRVTERGIAAMSDVDVDAAELGVEVEPGGIARLERSDVRAGTPVSGELRDDLGNDLRRPLPWFAIAGVTFVVLAFALQMVHRTRDRASRRPRRVPEGVVNVR